MKRFNDYENVDTKTLDELCVPLGVLPNVLAAASIVVACAVKLRRSIGSQERAAATAELVIAVDNYEAEMCERGLSIVGVITNDES